MPPPPRVTRQVVPPSVSSSRPVTEGVPQCQKGFCIRQAIAIKRAFCRLLGRVDELFDDDPCCHEMNKSQKGLAQFLIPRGNTSELFEVVEEPFDLLA